MLVVLRDPFLKGTVFDSDSGHFTWLGGQGKDADTSIKKDIAVLYGLECSAVP